MMDVRAIVACLFDAYV